MKTKCYLLIALMAMVSLIAACDCGDDDDDDDSGDDDAGDDDAGDDDVADDDVADDDVADDDSADDDAVDDDSADDDTDGTELFNITFDDYALGALTTPWIVNVSGTTEMVVVADPTEKGAQVLRVYGDPDNSGVAVYPFDHNTNNVSLYFKLYAQAGSAFGFGVLSTTNVNDWIMQIWRDPTTGEVIASPSFNTCATTLADNTWVDMQVDLDLTTGMFSVLINGADSTCMNQVGSGVAPLELASFFVEDWGDATWGGTYFFDDIIGIEYND